MEKRLSEEDQLPLCLLTGIRFGIATQDDIVSLYHLLITVYYTYN